MISLDMINAFNTVRDRGILETMDKYQVPNLTKAIVL